MFCAMKMKTLSVWPTVFCVFGHFLPAKGALCAPFPQGPAGSGKQGARGDGARRLVPELTRQALGRVLPQGGWAPSAGARPSRGVPAEQQRCRPVRGKGPPEQPPRPESTSARGQTSVGASANLCPAARAPVLQHRVLGWTVSGWTAPPQPHG